MKKTFMTTDGDLVTYREYLRTECWARVRLEAFDRSGGKCQLCGKPLDRKSGWHAHHNTYANLGCEQPADLLVLCVPCHDNYHEQKKIRERKNRKPKKSRARKWGGNAKPVMLTSSERKRRGKIRADVYYGQG